MPHHPPPRSVDDFLDQRPTITAAGAAAIGREPVGTIHVPLVEFTSVRTGRRWRPDHLDRRPDVVGYREGHR